MLLKLLKPIDAVLNRFTMYRVVLYGLIALLAAAEGLALTGMLQLSAGGLALSIVALVVSCYAANKLCAWAARAATNTESWLITALILACILPPVSSLARFGLVALAGAVAMAAKYVLVWRGSHIFNPAAIAAFVLSTAGLLPATWWIATPALVPFTTLLAAVVLRKQRKFALAICFGLAAVAMLVLVSVGLHDRVLLETLKQAIKSWPIIFMGSIMLTEPSTLPATRYYQLLYGVLVGAVFSAQLHVGRFATSPEASLLVGNLFTLFFTPGIGMLLRLSYLQQLSPDIFQAVFEPPRRRLAFAPGQYLEWTLPHQHTDSRGNRRTFSIASSPTEADIQIGFRHYQPSSSFKTALLALKPGQYIRAAHVAGSFLLPDDPSEPLLLIAGGIGITPFRSMVKYLTDAQQTRNITLLYFANRPEDFVYREVFETARAAGVDTRYLVGRPDTAAVRANAPDFAKRTAYLSGPDALVSNCKIMLQELGVKHIKTDHFSGY
ncbi:MAG TPA: FAD-dependent oxidoreductase [Candidatus Saccharimonadales bacterium]|nr:FAD-dependent oxidoreductase [Candidatus Saccharimonadales bacterium]